MTSTSKVPSFAEYAGQLVGCETIRDYCLGGRAVVTLHSPSGEYHSYYIRTPRNPDSFSPDVRFIYVKDENVWRYVGMLRGCKFTTTFGSRYENSHPYTKGAAYIAQMMTKDFETPMVLYHEGVCARCGRQLTKPESIVKGFGPTCYYRMKHGIEDDELPPCDIT